MGLQQITDDGTIQWDCHNGHAGQMAHISHEQVEWMRDGDLVGLPPCPECGSRLFVKTKFTEQELLPPIIARGKHPITGKEDAILSVQVPGAPNFTDIRWHWEEHVVDGEELQVIQVIDDVLIHPMPARHIELEKQLRALGKVPHEEKEAGS